MFEYWDYPLIPIAIILFILTTIFSFSHLMYIIFYIKIENDALPEFNNIIEGLKKNAEMNDEKTNKFVFLIKKIIFFTMKSFGVLANLTFISAMILILIAIIISM